MTYPAGTLLGPYEVETLLGAGGMGQVYQARDTRLHRPVALKFPQNTYQANPEHRARLLREARAASALRSANIAAIYDIGEHDGSMFIVMELVEGELLSKRIERGPLPVREAIDIGMQVADALQEAHARGVIHRDIKSANLIVTERGQVKVLDFGLAKFVNGSTGFDSGTTRTMETHAGMVQGTFSYMSPEQALGRPLDQRSDLFSLGVVIYESLAGRLPFDGASVTEILDQILHHDPPALARFNYGVSTELEAVVRKALEKDPEFRYQTARDLYIDLYKLSRTSTGSERFTAGARPADLGASRAASSAAERRRMGQAVVVMNFSNITKDPNDEWIGSGIAETVTSDLKSIQGLTVIGRAQLFDALKNQSDRALLGASDRAATDIGRQLGASWIVAGAYQRVGEVMRITAEITAVETGNVVKTVKIDGRMAEIFALQDRIVYELSTGLNLKLGQTEIVDIEQAETNSVEAYEAYSRGMINLRMAGRDSIDRAISLFERAVNHDPAYASAWAALGRAYELKGSFLSLPDVLDKSIEALRKAIDLNPKLASAHVSLGVTYTDIGRYDEAITAISEAIRLEPDNAPAHAALARAYWIGKGLLDEGIRELEITLRLNSKSGYSYLQLGYLYSLKGDYAKAEAACRRAIELQEQYISGTEGLLIVGGHTRLGYAFYLQGRYDEAIHEYEREMTFLTSSDHALRERSLIELTQKLGAAHLRMGHQADAERYFDRCITLYERMVLNGSDDPFTRYYVACLYALRGDPERSCDHLRATLVKLPALNTLRARIDPDLENLRNHPCSTELLSA
jgi:non-specific serine/threonine protein kinase